MADRLRLPRQPEAPRKTEIRPWFRVSLSGLVQATRSAWIRIRSALTVQGESEDDQSRPFLAVVLAAVFAAALVLSVSPILRQRGNPSWLTWLLGGLITLTGYSWARSGAYVKREAVERRGISQLVPVAWYHWSWKDYEPAGRFWAAAYWVFAVLTGAIWFYATG